MNVDYNLDYPRIYKTIILKKKTIIEGVIKL